MIALLINKNQSDVLQAYRSGLHHRACFRLLRVISLQHLVARVVASRVPPVPLVPLPRVLSRRAKYGVDPAYEIAVRVGSIVGQPVLDLLSAPLHASRRAGGDHSRQVAGLAVKHEIPRQVVLVDDVVTTGATLVAAAALVGEDRVSVALAANAASQVSSLSRR